MNMNSTPAPGKAAFWGGWALGGLPGLMLVLDAVMKLLKPDFVVKATVDLGYPEACIIPLGVVLLISTLLYFIPQTAVLGAILLTGYLGGAVASKVRAESGAFEILFPAIFGALLWFGLWLRDPRLRLLTPWRQL